jgi:hypothetical protein
MVSKSYRRFISFVKQHSIALFLLSFFFTTTKIISQTTIAGGSVYGNWTLAGSPYIINGSIQVPNDSTLTIDPGVTVSFQGTYKFLINGRLLAVGTVTDTIVFSAANTSSGWRGIRFDNTNVTNDSSKIIYCKIQHGKAYGPIPEDKGGGLYIDNFSKVLVSNSTITYCKAKSRGGGIYIKSADPSVLNCNLSYDSLDFTGWGDGGAAICLIASNSNINNNIISNNASSPNANGGGIYIEQGGPYTIIPVISNNTIQNNSSGNGGGIHISSGSPSIIDNTILNNFSPLGGGIYILSSFVYPPSYIANNVISYNSSYVAGGIDCMGRTIINNNIISHNTTRADGGGIRCFSDSVIISNNIICNNIVQDSTYIDDGGGGISFLNCNPGTLMYNNIVCNNTAYNGAGILCSGGGNPTLANNTISNNNALYNGGALLCTSNSSPVLYNCILWGNTDTTNNTQVYLHDEPSDPSFYYCDVQGNNTSFNLNTNFYTGSYQNNIDIDPLFVLPSTGTGIGFNGVTADWSLQAGSSCINTGNPNGTYTSTDIAGNPRVSENIIDIGAYEYQGISTEFPDSKKGMEFRFVPNPSTGKFILRNSDVGKIEIYDILGKIVSTQNVNQKNQAIEIDLSGSKRGVYVAKYTLNDQTRYTERIILQ